MILLKTIVVVGVVEPNRVVYRPHCGAVPVKG